MMDTTEVSGRKEVAPGLTLYGAAAPALASLVRLRPALGFHLLLSHARDVHARAAFVAAAAERGDKPMAIADALLARNPRDLLRDALGGAAHPRLYRSLGRCYLPAWPLETYLLLDALLGAGLDDAADDGHGLRAHAVEEAAVLLHSDPLVRRARRALRGPHERDALTVLLTTLRAHGASGPLEAAPDALGRSALVRHVERAVGGLRSPHVGSLTAPPGWHLVGSVGELWQIGRALHLCCGRGALMAGEHALALAEGRSAYLYQTKQGILAELNHCLGHYAVVQMSKAKNARVSTAVREGLVEHMRQAGVPIQNIPLDAALRALLPWQFESDDGRQELPPLAAAEDHPPSFGRATG